MSELEDFRRACDMKTWGGRVIAALLDHVAALEGGAKVKIKCHYCDSVYDSNATYEEHVATYHNQSKPAPTPATVEKYTVYGFIKLQYCVGDGGGSLQYQNHFVRSAIGEVVATLALPHEYTKTQVVLTLPDGQSINLFTEEYRALVTMMVDNKYWEKING